VKADTEIASLSSTVSARILISEPYVEEEPIYKSPYRNTKLLERTSDVEQCLTKHIKNKVEFENRVYQIVLKYGMDHELIMRQIRRESEFKAKAVSPAGAKGIAQFMPGTGRSYGLKTRADFFDPYKSIDAMVHHMSDLYKTFLNNKKLNPRHDKVIAYRLALAAYNAGPGNVRKGIPRYRETLNYIAYIYKNTNYQPQILN
jgi:soluble lytic murein transglycosylase-like protein